MSPTETWSTVVRSRPKRPTGLIAAVKPPAGKPKKPVIGTARATGIAAVEKRKRRANIFASRFAPDQCPVALKRYLDSDLQTSVTCTKLDTKHPDDYSSFLVVADVDNPRSLLDGQLWPENIFVRWYSILTNKRLSLGVRKRVLQCYIEPILLYGCEAWSMTKQTSTSIEAIEMWFLRRMLRVSWTEKRTNLEILNTASSTRKLMNNIKRRQAEFLGHVMRKGKLEHLLTTGNIEGKRSRGRQRIKIQDGIAAWLGRSTAEMLVDARDRKKWKVMIAYACNRHGN